MVETKKNSFEEGIVELAGINTNEFDWKENVLLYVGLSLLAYCFWSLIGKALLELFGVASPSSAIMIFPALLGMGLVIMAFGCAWERGQSAEMQAREKEKELIRKEQEANKEFKKLMNTLMRVE